MSRVRKLITWTKKRLPTSVLRIETKFLLDKTLKCINLSLFPLYFNNRRGFVEDRKTETSIFFFSVTCLLHKRRLVTVNLVSSRKGSVCRLREPERTPGPTRSPRLNVKGRPRIYRPRLTITEKDGITPHLIPWTTKLDTLEICFVQRWNDGPFTIN